MAADRAASADVKAFGQMMVTEHSKANDELKQALKKHVRKEIGALAVPDESTCHSEEDAAG